MPETITPNSPLFKTWKHGKVKRVSRSTISAMILRHFQQIGESKMSAHSFRKKLQTDLEKSGMNTNWIDQVLGHELINSRDAYSLPTDEELKDAYIKAYPIIRIYPDLSQSPAMTNTQTPSTIKTTINIQATNKIQTQESEILEVKANDIQAIKQALLKGYKHADTVGEIRLYMR